MSFKEQVVEELRETIERERLTIEDVLEMLKQASTTEVCLLRNNLLKMHPSWKKSRNVRQDLLLTPHDC